jgi:hypothetical protein
VTHATGRVSSLAPDPGVWFNDRMRGIIRSLTLTLVLCGLAGVASAKDPELAECRQQCSIGRDTCKEGCQVDRPTGWGSESQGYADCDQNCKSDYETCTYQCKNGQD